MENNFKILYQTRQNILKSIEDLSTSQLNKIPDGFKNSIFWNVAHIFVTQQLLHYFLSGNKSYLSEEIINKYRKGTFPESTPSNDEIKQIKEYIIELPVLLKNDYKKKMFSEYKEYPTSYGYTLSSIEEAIAFNNIHEGLHLGYILAMKKLV